MSFHDKLNDELLDSFFSPPGFDLPSDCGFQVHHYSTPQCCEQDPEEHVWTLQHFGSAGHDGSRPNHLHLSLLIKAISSNVMHI